MAAIHGLRLGDILSSPMIRISAAISLFLLCYATWAAEIVHSASEEEVFALQSAAQSGNRSAIRELFDMHVDGAVAEDIDVVLGRTIRHHP
ncbi:MAG: hypothetical protein JSS21_11505, partial [Proteobacteria bacterium]|nr:hypothetical protein [Pseudomonadota bacterium]